MSPDHTYWNDNSRVAFRGSDSAGRWLEFVKVFGEAEGTLAYFWKDRRRYTIQLVGGTLDDNTFVLSSLDGDFRYEGHLDGVRYAGTVTVNGAEAGIWSAKRSRWR